MSIPDVDIHIGDLYETTLMKYASGQLMNDGMIMLKLIITNFLVDLFHFMWYYFSFFLLSKARRLHMVFIL